LGIRAWKCIEIQSEKPNRCYTAQYCAWQVRVLSRILWGRCWSHFVQHLETERSAERWKDHVAKMAEAHLIIHSYLLQYRRGAMLYKQTVLTLGRTHDQLGGQVHNIHNQKILVEREKIGTK
jgi:hypothetical protein